MKMPKTYIVVLVVIIVAAIAAALVPLPFAQTTRITNSVFINRSPEAVFSYVTTPGNWPKWHPSSLGVSGATDHPLAVGEKVTEDFRVAGSRGLAVWTVVQSDFAKSWTIDGTISGRAAGSVRYQLAPEKDGTRFLREFVYGSPNLIFVLLNGLYIRGQIQSESEQAVQQLKQALETGAVFPADK